MSKFTVDASFFVRVSREFVHPIFFCFFACEQCITDKSPRKRQNSAQLQGLSRVFPISRNSALPKKGPQNDKLANRRRGQLRPFPSGFFVITGGFRGDQVIRPLFYYFFPRATGACPSRASEVPRLRASLAARATSSRLQKLTSATPDEAPGGPLSSVAARAIQR